jgi:hypothetical protein
MRHAEYDCDRCGAETPDGHGHYYKGERLCPECCEGLPFWEYLDADLTVGDDD